MQLDIGLAFGNCCELNDTQLSEATIDAIIPSPTYSVHLSPLGPTQFSVNLVRNRFPLKETSAVLPKNLIVKGNPPGGVGLLQVNKGLVSCAFEVCALNCKIQMHKILNVTLILFRKIILLLHNFSL